MAIAVKVWSIPPVVRPEATGVDTVTWGEFVELGYLREYRRSGASLQQLRPVIEELRREFSTPYPLATAKPYLMGKELVLEIQQKHGLAEPMAMVIRSGQQILLANAAHRFFKKVEFNQQGHNGEAIRLRPAGMTSPVTIDPSCGLAAQWFRV